jgi:DNA-directed RNA polymerase specialized sigma24 family protein
MDATWFAMEADGLIPISGDAHAQDERSGEPADLGAVFDANAAALYRTIVAFTGGRADIAEEAVAEAFARAAARTDTIRDPVAWLYRVAFNAATDELRRERRHANQDPPETRRRRPR